MKIKKIHILLIPIFLFLIGCGGENSIQENSTSTTQKIKNYTNGTINLWDYLVPNKETTNSYIKTDGDTSEKYRAYYTKSENIVTETTDYATNEKTVYIKNTNNITILFYTNGASNGSLELKPTVDIGEMVTIKKSDCSLVKIWDTFNYQQKNFSDVIEIRCGNLPGYYQKGVGEILQEQLLSQNGKVETKFIITNN